MMIDIDHFKLFNDRYGHVARRRLPARGRRGASLVTLELAVLVARYGGEEFALLLPGLELERATALGEEARRAIEDLLIVHAETPHGLVTISIGVASHGAANRSNGRRIWSKPPTARSTRPNGAAAILWSRGCRCSSAPHPDRLTVRH